MGGGERVWIALTEQAKPGGTTREQGRGQKPPRRVFYPKIIEFLNGRWSFDTTVISSYQNITILSI